MLATIAAMCYVHISNWAKAIIDECIAPKRCYIADRTHGVLNILSVM
jgi:hypothetical protein